jgi:hypothetical protein
MTIIRLVRRDRAGRVVSDRRCDGRCHLNRAKVSRCLCRGRFSGAGERAKALLLENWEVVREIRESHPGADISVPEEIRQLGLW